MFVEPADIVNFMVSHAPIREMMRDEMLVKQYIEQFIKVEVLYYPIDAINTNDSKIKYITTFSAGKKHGFCIKLYKNGIINVIEYYRNGMMHLSKCVTLTTQRISRKWGTICTRLLSLWCGLLV
jgi:antitoxin component YwqK of YwqJK toxin-antitoxin module